MNSNLTLPGRFGINEDRLKILLSNCLKPEEISGDPLTQHTRVIELLSWFSREPEFAGNPKWLRGHGSELAYYLAAGSSLERLDLGALKKRKFDEGFFISEKDREILTRIGYKAG